MPAPRKPAPSPLSELLLLQREINTLVARMGGPVAPRATPTGEWSPRVDVFDSGESLRVVVEVPGLTPDALTVVGRGGRLTVSGERKGPRVPGATFHCLERASGRFNRTVPLDVPVDLSRAKAVLRDGVLTVDLPRLPERRGRDIDIPIQREEPA